MSTLTLPTRELVGLLTDTTLTAGSAPDRLYLATVLLDCDRGEGADGEPSDLLIATSTDDSSMAAQAHTACTGRLHKPVLISTVDVTALVKVFKPLMGSGKTVTRQVQLEVTGEFLTVSEDLQQAPDGISVTVPILDPVDYPRTIPAFLQPDPASVVVVDGEPMAPAYGTGVGYGHLEVIGKVGKRRKMDPRMYRYHQRRGVVVTIGSMYRAVFMPCPLDGKGEYDEPQVPVFTPRLPAKAGKVESVQPLASVR